MVNPRRPLEAVEAMVVVELEAAEAVALEAEEEAVEVALEGGMVVAEDKELKDK